MSEWLMASIQRDMVGLQAGIAEERDALPAVTEEQI